MDLWWINNIDTVVITSNKRRAIITFCISFDFAVEWQIIFSLKF